MVSLPVLRIETPGNRAVELNGKIDRVDAAGEGEGAAGDGGGLQESSNKRELKLDWVYWGLSLQLPVYAIVMEELWKRGGEGAEAIAAMYVPLGIGRQTVQRAMEAENPETDEFYQQFSPRGIVDAEGAVAMDHAVGPREDEGGKSAWYKIGFNRDGTIPKGGDMVGHGDFRTVLAYVRWKIGRMVDDLAAGKIGPAPYRAQRESPCENCDFFSLCPFDRASGIVSGCATDEAG